MLLLELFEMLELLKLLLKKGLLAAIGDYLFLARP